MNKLSSEFRISKCIMSVAGFVLIGCVSGPVTTQINTKKNPVVSAPKEFQSPYQAIDNFLEVTTTNKDLKKQKDGSLNSLLSRQNAIAREFQASGKLRLQPGASYEFDLESFCVHAGVERPVNGDGLFLGDIEGPAKSWLPAILQKYKEKGISQEETQLLIWSLLSKFKFDELTPKSQANLIKIFPDAAIRFGNSYFEDQAKDILLSQLSPELLSAKNEFERYQELLQDSQLKYAEVEKVLSPYSTRNNSIDVGWLKHADGYYIHLQATGYTQVHIKIYAPVDIKLNTYFIPTNYIAIPGQGQRLAFSFAVIDRYADKFNQKFKDSFGITTPEANFIDKYPLDAYKIYQAAEKALRESWKLPSTRNYQDDNTDAYRHFVWSGLVAKEIGPEKAREYLYAHEEYQENNLDSKRMDIFNNEKGIQYAKNYKGNDFENDLFREGLQKMKDKELRWIK